MNRYIQLITDRCFRFSVLSKYGFYKWMSDRKHIQTKFRFEFGYDIDLEQPKTYNEKLQWIKLNDRRAEYTTMVDKYEAKRYIESCIGTGYVIPVVGGPWKSFDEIDFDKLPNQFVLKTTHDCGGVYICTDKARFDYVKARKFLVRHLKSNYYITCREWPYKNVEPRLFA